MSDYISREETLERLCKDVCNVSDCQCDEIRCEEWFVIHNVPAADVRPVVKAHWTDRRTIEHDGEWYCSACGKEITIYMGADRPDRYRYCPNCGARMEER